MTEQEQIDFDRIAKAIEYISEHFKEQPSLNKLAEKVHLSPFHFQRLFTSWAGVSPKKFMQYMSIQHAKKLLTEHQLTLSEASYETGLSGTSRLHDLFINIEGMTPGEYKNHGHTLSINYDFVQSPFGKILIASTSKGICHLSFVSDSNEAFHELRSRFKNAKYTNTKDELQRDALNIFSNDVNQLNKIKLHLHGTPFQLKVWEALLKIPKGLVTTYGNIAKEIDRPNASRAVGTAIGNNPIAFLIPCHRVIQSSGNIGGYRWGTTRKTAIIGWESSTTEK